jgi:trimeric autotransporter adhesin
MGLVELIFGICRNRSRLELYDVNFGGIEKMTKRLTIALVALAMFLLVMVMPVMAVPSVPAGYYVVAKNIGAGATVFIGEQGLNVTTAVNTTGGVTAIGYWASAAPLTTSAASKTIPITANADSFTVTFGDFGGYTGDWYRIDPATQTTYNPAQLAFRVADPTLDVNIWDATISADVTSKSVPKGELLQFGIVTNMYAALSPANRGPVFNTSTGDGYLDLKVKTESGAVLTQLYTNTAGTTSARLTSINVTTQPYTWGLAPLDALGTGQAGVPPFNWTTDAANGGQPAYAPGTYTVWVESLLNNMKVKYTDASGAAYTGKTVSPVRTITIVSDTVKITVNKDSVVRSKPFSVTIVGKPSATYCLWVKGSRSLGNSLDNQPPLLTLFQAGVTANESVVCGNYEAQNMGTIISDTYNAAGGATNALRYANVSMTSSGTRTVEFQTNNWTKAQKYTIRVEQNFSGQIRSDQVDVKVEKGAVTVVAAGDQSYYLGEEVKFSGTNTESFLTWMFIIGPNLNANGGQLDNPRVALGTGTMVSADVQSDNTWSYKWGTSALALDAGTYTVYAVSQPVDRAHLADAAYGTVSIIIKKPFVSATASQSTVAKGDKIFITGTAEGQPAAGVQIWILGKNYDKKATASVESDSSFKYEVTSATTSTLYAGQYFVVVQHPMQNGVFDIDTDRATGQGSGDVFVQNKMLGVSTAYPTGTTTIFKLEGSGSLQGSDAAEALVQGINDPNVDDTYTKLQFLVEEGIITIDPIGDRHVGDKFTITAQTNLAVDDEILVQVYSSSFKPTQKSQSGEFSGATGTVKVTKGDSGMNKISFDVDASTFKPDEYIVTEEAVIQGTTGTALYNVLEGAAPTAVPTTVVTTVAPTTVPTTVPTTMPTPTPTKSPGYGALIALIGLGAVAFIVVRRH